MANGDGTRNLAIGLLVALAVIVLLPLFIGGTMMGGMMGRWGDGMWSWGGWGMGLGAIFMLVFWGIIIAAIVLVVRWMAQPSGGAHPPTTKEESALEILQKRYARGEINKEEYEQKRRDLTS